MSLKRRQSALKLLSYDIPDDPRFKGFILRFYRKNGKSCTPYEAFSTLKFFKGSRKYAVFHTHTTATRRANTRHAFIRECLREILSREANRKQKEAEKKAKALAKKKAAKKKPAKKADVKKSSKKKPVKKTGKKPSRKPVPDELVERPEPESEEDIYEPSTFRPGSRLDHLPSDRIPKALFKKFSKKEDQISKRIYSMRYGRRFDIIVRKYRFKTPVLWNEYRLKTQMEKMRAALGKVLKDSLAYKGNKKFLLVRASHTEHRDRVNVLDGWGLRRMMIRSERDLQEYLELFINHYLKRMELYLLGGRIISVSGFSVEWG